MRRPDAAGLIRPTLLTLVAVLAVGDGGPRRVRPFQPRADAAGRHAGARSSDDGVAPAPLRVATGAFRARERERAGTPSATLARVDRSARR